MIQAVHIDAMTTTTGKSRSLIVIVWLFVAIIVLVLAFTCYSVGLLSAGRAYVGGEGLWSKAQKDMIYSLTRYIHSHDQIDYQAYIQSLAVCRGDHQARLELEKKNPDMRIAFVGFFQGRNHPDDIDGMIRLFRNFRHVSEIDKAIDIWTHADAEIDQLIILAERIHTAVQGGQLDDASAQFYRNQVVQINQRLMPMEDAFSYTLGEAARKTQTLLLFVMFAVVSVLLPTTYVFSRRLLRQSDDVQSALREGEKQLSDLLKFAPLPIIIVRLADETVLYANDHALTQFKVPAALLHPLHMRNFYLRKADRNSFLARLHEEGSVRDWEVRLQDTEGLPFWALISAQRISYKWQDCILTAINNINERKRTQQELQHRANYDNLTGLPNRAMFMDTLRSLLAKATPKNDVFAILFIDLDRFKIINDERGHEVGDCLLQEVALRLKSSIRNGDFVSRLGGDEFVVLIEDCAEADLIIHTAQRILDAIEPCCVFDGHQVNITTSIGVSCYPQDGTDLKTLMRNADVAMYRAKEQGRNKFQCYSVLENHLRVNHAMRDS